MSWFKKFDSKQKTQKEQKYEKACFPKEIVEDADLYKPVLHKTMTTQSFKLYKYLYTYIPWKYAWDLKFRTQLKQHIEF